MRVLITCVGAYGHLHPLLPLAEALVAKGHEVTIATGPDVRARAEAAGYAALKSGLSTEEALNRITERFPNEEYNRVAPTEILDWWVPHLFGEVFAPAMLVDLEPLVRCLHPDIIVHDVWELAGPIAAASAGLPSISHTLGPRFAHRVIEAAASAVAPLWRQCGLDPDHSAGLYRHLCLDITPPGLQALQPSRQQRRSAGLVRPLRPMAPQPLPGEALPQWVLDRRGGSDEPGAGVPLVYMTLGTNTNSDLTIFRSVMSGLSDLRIEVLITLGPGSDPACLGHVAANVHVESYVPQSLLLPYCSAVVCHGGAGTVLNALALGLPLLVMPQGADQYAIGDLVRASGAGLLVTPRQVTPSAVRPSVLALLYEPSYGTAARRLQTEIAAMPGPEEAVHLIEEVADRS